MLIFVPVVGIMGRRQRRLRSRTDIIDHALVLEPTIVKNDHCPALLWMLISRLRAYEEALPLIVSHIVKVRLMYEQWPP